jgi:hypothetical protein
MVLLISLLLALIPFLGFVWIVVQGSFTTVDGLFTSLILLAISGVLGGSALFELRRHRSGSGPKLAWRTGQASSAVSGGGQVQRGRVESVLFFESDVGPTNKSIVTLLNGSDSPRTLVFDGDMRSALPTGQKVEVTFRKGSGHNVLVHVNYA